MFFLAKTITIPSWSKFYHRSGLIRGLGGSKVKAICIIKGDRPPNKPPKADCLDEANAFHQHIQKRRDILDVRAV